jgi:hypothetical protein
VLASPAPDVEILQFTVAGPVFAVHPYIADYGQVYFDTNWLIPQGLHDAGFPFPERTTHSPSPAADLLLNLLTPGCTHLSGMYN